MHVTVLIAVAGNVDVVVENGETALPLVIVSITPYPSYGVPVDLYKRRISLTTSTVLSRKKLV